MVTTRKRAGSATDIDVLARLMTDLCRRLGAYVSANADARDRLAASLDLEIGELAELIRLLFYERRADREAEIAELQARLDGWAPRVLSQWQSAALAEIESREVV